MTVAGMPCKEFSELLTLAQQKANARIVRDKTGVTGTILAHLCDHHKELPPGVMVFENVPSSRCVPVSPTHGCFSGGAPLAGWVYS